MKYISDDGQCTSIDPNEILKYEAGKDIENNTMLLLKEIFEEASNSTFDIADEIADTIFLSRGKILRILNAYNKGIEVSEHKCSKYGKLTSEKKELIKMYKKEYPAASAKEIKEYLDLDVSETTIRRAFNA